jgi:hypothetical protein
LHVLDRERRTFVPNLGDDIFSRIKTINVNWRSNACRTHGALDFTTHFTRIDGPRVWKIRFEMHSDPGPTEDPRQIISYLEWLVLKGLERAYPCAWASGEEMLSFGFSFCVRNVLYPGVI